MNSVNPNGMISLVLGPSGAGKTFLASTFRARGLHAIDADCVPGLCGWFTLEGVPTKYPINAGHEFLSCHHFLWDKDVLRELIRHERESYVFGMPRNAFEAIDLFNAVCYLRVPPGVLLNRLQSASRNNPMGQTQYQRDYCLDRAKETEIVARKLGIRFVDATKEVDQIVADIVGMASIAAARV